MAEKKSLRALPSVEQLLSSGRFGADIDKLSRPLVTVVIREVLDGIRDEVRGGANLPDPEETNVRIAARLRGLERRRITRVINGTGIMIHTNLGRAPLGVKLLSRVFERVSAYNTLEFDLHTGKRGKRGSFLSYLISQLTGAEACLVVNNNAAAVFLILNTFADRKQVVISRSELVQIGGDFRIPDIIRRAGAKMVEIGTTNKTLARDYEQAITKTTTTLLKVHRSNFSIEGFVEEVSPAAVANIARKRNLISVFDLGSGAYHQTEKFGMEAEPNITEALRSGADIVCFSGDKLLAAAQGGIILGKADLIGKMNRNPIYRALRPDKLTIALLEEAAFAYLKKEETDLLPLWQMITRPVADLKQRALAVRKALADTSLKIEVVKSQSTPGGGSLPGGKLKSIALAIQSKEKPVKFARLLLEAEPPLIGYIENEKLHIDMRTVFDGEDETVIRILREADACTR
jgi:L-seryl-tRNA(Ser) seleniumtransferase